MKGLMKWFGFRKKPTKLDKAVEKAVEKILPKIEIKTVEQDRMVERILPEQAETIELLLTSEPCSAVTVVNEKESIKRAAAAFYKSARMWFVISTAIILATIVALFQIVALAGITAALIPIGFILIAAAVIMRLAFRDDVTARNLRKALKEEYPGKNYILCFSSPTSLIHELLHVKKGHLEKKGRTLKYEFEVVREMRKIIREIKEDF